MKRVGVECKNDLEDVDPVTLMFAVPVLDDCTLQDNETAQLRKRET